MKEEKCIKCGQKESRHPYGYTTPVHSKMRFIWKCKKFRIRNKI